MVFCFRCEFYWRHFLEASAVGVPSLHRLRLQGNCGILSMPLYMFVVAVGSPLSLVDGVAFAMLSLPRGFLVVVFYSVGRAQFQVGVLAPEEFQWTFSPVIW